MPTSSKSLRSQTASLRKERSTIRRSSYHSSSLFDATTVMSTSPTDRRRRTSTRAREMRSASFSQHSPHFADLVVSGTSPIMAGTASSPSPDGGEDTPRTKTGRISTAKKGKPVHKCEDCGKVILLYMTIDVEVLALTINRSIPETSTLSMHLSGGHNLVFTSRLTLLQTPPVEPQQQINTV